MLTLLDAAKEAPIYSVMLRLAQPNRSIQTSATCSNRFCDLAMLSAE
jgi:hypothetical protein